MGSIVLPVLIGVGIIAIILFSSFSTIQPNTGTNSLVEHTETQLTSIVTMTQIETKKVTSTSSVVVPEKEQNISTLSNYNNKILPRAHAVTSSQLEISVDMWDANIGDNVDAFDPQGNFYDKGSSNKITRVDIVSNTVTQWTLPNNESVRSQTVGVDSSGNVYFAQEETKLGSLNPNTDVFTEWTVMPDGIDFVSVDQFDNVYFAVSGNDPFTSKLDVSTNTVTSWFLPPEHVDVGIVIESRIVFDLSGNVYFANSPGILNSVVKLDISSNTLTEWVLPSDTNPNGIAVGPTGKIYLSESVPFRSKIGELDPSTNILKEWTLPESIGQPGPIVVDSNGNVFFGSNFARLVPSTDTITTWSLCAQPLKVDPSDVIHFSCGNTGGTIS